jgi:hypothetical protein
VALQLPRCYLVGMVAAVRIAIESFGCAPFGPSQLL